MKFPEEAAARWWNPVAMTRGAARFLGFVASDECWPIVDRHYHHPPPKIS
jgi:hypothetical protein